jgi:hypothetical protein
MYHAGENMCFGCISFQLRDVQVSSMRGIHSGAVGKAHRQGSLRFDFVQACRIDQEKVDGATGVHYCCIMLFK